MDIQKCWNWLQNPPLDGPQATILLRFMAGSVFIWEGIMKFVFASLGVARFTKLGFPFPGPTADFVAVLEIVGGLMMIAGWKTRFISLVFVFQMIVAVLSTKIPMFLGTYPLFLPPSPPQGIWAVLHEVRSEFAQMFVSLYLLLAGPGPMSLDKQRNGR